MILAAREREQQRAGGRDNTGPSYRPGTRQKDSKKQDPSLGREPAIIKTCLCLSWVLIGSLLGNSFSSDWSGTGDHTIPQWIPGDSIDEDHSEGDDIGQVHLGYNDRTWAEVWNSLELDVGSALLVLMEQDYKISAQQSLEGFL